MQVDEFIVRWTAREGGAERANYQMFASELCDLIEAPRPDPAGVETARNDYVFERAVRQRADDEGGPRRIDLYKKGCFILEAKQSRLPGAKNALPGQLSLVIDEPEQLGRRNVARGWDVMMINARKQAENYVFLLDASHPAPPFIITCDVGHAFEIFADFSGTGRAYSQFPDRKGFRIFLEDLRDPAVRALLRMIWTDPMSLDPARHSARVTRGVAARLAEVSKALEVRHAAEEVAHFLMRCIFTMFAEDVDLLPKGKFGELLAGCLDSPGAFVPLVEELWAKMDEPLAARRFFSGFRETVRHFNGNLFKDARAFPLGREEIGELLQAAKAKWTEVDPAIFGTLLEQALEPGERRRLGAHYTPRAYVQRLVEATLMEPLRDDWQKALTKAEDARESGDEQQAIEILRGFHRKLCATRVLDPACGTGNFLYVALELMKKLEGGVLEALARLGANESLALEGETVDPHQFLGLERNPRAAAIAELVVWIGYLQQHYRTHSGHPAEPILKAFRNINFGRREGYDALLTWDGWPVTGVEARDGQRVESYPNARRAEWPEAEFIVGNPPFIGKGAAMRASLGDGYVAALRAAWPKMNESADLVMYWWDRAAELLTAKGMPFRSFGFVTTNSITQMFNRRVIERHLNAKLPVSIVHATPDHPWTKATRDAAAVRIAMTVAKAGTWDGVLLDVQSESGLDTDEPQISFHAHHGRINADLTVGADASAATAMKANAGISFNGMMLAGRGFVLSAKHELNLTEMDGGLSRRVVRPFLRGADLVRSPRSAFVIDLSEMTAYEARTAAPAAYAHLLDHVKPERDISRDAGFRKHWWRFGRTRPELRSALSGTARFIGTTETAKHRLFQFIPTTVIPDHMIISIALESAEFLALLSSRIHTTWALAAGGWLGVGNDPRYSKSRCFDPFPFPELSDRQRGPLREAGEELDGLRKRVLAAHADLTLTGLYNVLEKVKAGGVLSEKEEDVKQRGLVLIIRELHETIDRLTAEAYGWPADLADQQILERLVALNAERAREEAEGHVRWLRPDYQVPRFAKGTAARSGELELETTIVSIDARKPDFPKKRDEHPFAVEAVLAASQMPLDAATIARAFRGGGRRIEPRVAQVLNTLALYGRATALADGRFAARRAA